MCGIVGIVTNSREDRPRLADVVMRMAATLVHRGPDDGGVWVSDSGGVAFGHRRLSIVDLSPLGHQPMASRSGRFTTVFNGEIYNHHSLRKDLVAHGHVFRGGSDTEVLLAAVEEWGLEEALRRSVGMFAIALWDNQDRELSLARDRLGEKPLYVRQDSSGVAFASESRALLCALGAVPAIDDLSLAMYLAFGYVPEPRSIFTDIRILKPGTIEVWSCGDGALSAPSRKVRFWSARTAVPRVARDAASIVNMLDDQLRASISDQMVADVPVGCLLSGGIDSTAVAAVMQSISRDPVLTFCVSFDDPTYDEGPFARSIAAHIGSDHIEVPVTEAELLGLVNDIPSVYDEPFADSSQLPTMAVARATRRRVTVALSGDGGDELFGGYNRYYWPREIRRRFRFVPAPLRRFLGRSLEGGSRQLPEPVVRLAQRVMMGAGPTQDFRGKLTKAGRQLQKDSLQDGYLQLICRDMSLSGSSAPPEGVAALRALFGEMEPFEAMTLWDIENYLPGDNLVKVDRASMAVSLEMRAPLLDHRVCELARGVIQAFGYDAFRASPKWPLRQLAYRYVPRRLLDRPKMGFSVPMSRWLREGLKPWGDGLVAGAAPALFDDRLRHTLSEAWVAHQNRSADHADTLWPLLVFLQWADRLPQSMSQPVLNS